MKQIVSGLRGKPTMRTCAHCSIQNITKRRSESNAKNRWTGFGYEADEKMVEAG